MKIAARFPVKESPLLGSLIISIHLIIVGCSYLVFGFDWQWGIILVLTLVTLVISFKQYRRLTIAPDDLCWSGENWLITDPQTSKSVTYLELSPQSWLSSFACILNFDHGGEQKQWLFTRQQLGRRSFSELCYLAKQSLLKQAKQDKPLL